jgi:membrane protease subunit HflC
MSPKMSFFLIVVLFGAVIVGMSVFVVDEREHAIKFQFREIVRADYEPGLHFKWPIAQNVIKYPDRILTYEDSEERFLTGEQKNLVVDYFVTWRIVDPSLYYERFAGDERAAVDRVAAIVKEGIKAAISQRDVQEVVSAERSALLDDMLIEVENTAPELGIEVVDVRVKRIDLEDEVTESVFNRMREERRRQAEQLRAEGNEDAEEIRANADRERTEILSQAREEAEIIRGAGDAQAANIYAGAYAQDRDFYAFYRSMSAYRESIGGTQDVLVLQPDSEFFRYLQSQFGSEAVSAD